VSYSAPPDFLTVIRGRGGGERKMLGTVMERKGRDGKKHEGVGRDGKGKGEWEGRWRIRGSKGAVGGKGRERGRARLGYLSRCPRVPSYATPVKLMHMTSGIYR